MCDVIEFLNGPAAPRLAKEKNGVVPESQHVLQIFKSFVSKRLSLSFCL